MFEFTQTVRLVPQPGVDPSQHMPARVSNPQIAEVLFNIATLLEMQQANPYRIEAYRNAARGMLSLPEPAAEIITRGERLEAPGLGERLRAKITELIQTGHMTFYDDLCEESLPEDVRELMRVPRVGPRTALRLTGQLDIHSIADLARAAEAGKLRDYYGFGPRSERNLAIGARAVLSAPAASETTDTLVETAPVADESAQPPAPVVPITTPVTTPVTTPDTAHPATAAA